MQTDSPDQQIAGSSFPICARGVRCGELGREEPWFYPIVNRSRLAIDFHKSGSPREDAEWREQRQDEPDHGVRVMLGADTPPARLGLTIGIYRGK